MGFYKFQCSNEFLYLNGSREVFFFFSPLTGWALRVKVSMDLGAFACFIGLCVIFSHFIMLIKGERKKELECLLISNSLPKGS